MRIVLITGNDLQHRYVANRLSSAVKLSGIIVDRGRALGLLGRARQLYRRYTLLQLASRGGLAIMRRVWRDDSVRRKATVAIWGQENCLEFSQRDLVQYLNGINTPEGVRAIASLEPDVILVFGTGIIGNRVLSLAREVALNMHTGISPFYRGADCTFWPLYHQELHMLGATVHECTMAIDGGRIFGTTGVELQRDDGLFTVYARCVAAGATLYAEIVTTVVNHKLEGRVQDFSVGREYKAHMKGIRAEWKVRRMIRNGLIREFVTTCNGRSSSVGPPALSTS